MTTTQIENIPELGGTAPRQAWRTARKLANFAIRYVASIQCSPEMESYLDGIAKNRGSDRKELHETSTEARVVFAFDRDALIVHDAEGGNRTDVKCDLQRQQHP